MAIKPGLDGIKIVKIFKTCTDHVLHVRADKSKRHPLKNAIKPNEKKIIFLLYKIDIILVDVGYLYTTSMYNVCGIR